MYFYCSDNSWHHYTITLDSNEKIRAFYIDGELEHFSRRTFTVKIVKENYVVVDHIQNNSSLLSEDSMTIITQVCIILSKEIIMLFIYLLC